MLLTRNLIVALIATVISFSTLYIPQPMLPLLADYFGVSAGEAGLLMTVAMLPLAFAPVIYGYFLQAVPARLMLMIALSLLALNQVCFYFADEFWHLIDPSHPQHDAEEQKRLGNVILDFFKEVDAAVGRLVDALPDGWSPPRSSLPGVATAA